MNNFSQLVKLTTSIRFEVTLAEILIGLFILGILAVMLILIGKYMKKNKEIDARLKQRLQEIHGILSETTLSPVPDYSGVSESAEPIGSGKIDKPVPVAEELLNAPEPAGPLPVEEQTTAKHNQPEEQSPVNVKKTRQMSMEERWADYEAKRAAQRKSA